MALIRCPECKKNISDAANQCPHCGLQLTSEMIEHAKANQSKLKKNVGIGCLGLIVLMIILSVIGRENADKAPEKAKSLSSPSAATDVTEVSPMLELQGWHWSESYGYAKAEGQVQNISEKSLKNVEAVVSWYAKNGDFITSDSALIEYNPLLPGQVSPFTVVTGYNPAMERATVEFKELMGGAISYKIKEKK